MLTPQLLSLKIRPPKTTAGVFPTDLDDTPYACGTSGVKEFFTIV